MVRAGESGRFFEEFKKEDLVAIGWKSVGNLSKVRDPHEIKRIVDSKYPDQKPGWRIVTSGQIVRFRFDFQAGDYVTTYDPDSRTYLVGKIKGPYTWDPSRREYFHVREVDWEGKVPRDKLSASTRNTLGGATTIFDVGQDAQNEMLQILTTGKPPATSDQEDPEEDLEQIVRDQASRGREMIKDKITKLDWDEAQRLVAAILQAMGYKARISPVGADRGKDIEASPDGLGLEEPRIVVQVKHRTERIGSQDLKSFIAGLRTGHKGLFVSTGGFTNEAKLEADRSNVPLTLIDIESLADLTLQYYDKFDAESRVLLPLTKVYWPK